jgi:hypothetical protein
VLVLFWYYHVQVTSVLHSKATLHTRGYKKLTLTGSGLWPFEWPGNSRLEIPLMSICRPVTSTCTNMHVRNAQYCRPIATNQCTVPTISINFPISNIVKNRSCLEREGRKYLNEPYAGIQTHPKIIQCTVCVCVCVCVCVSEFRCSKDCSKNIFVLQRIQVRCDRA